MAQTVEAQLVDGVTVWGVAHVDDLVEVLHGRPVLCPPTLNTQVTTSPVTMDLVDVVGQPEARWALEVAAAGGHHIFFHGPPGVGKTMLAERLPGLLPELDDEQALEVSAIHSLAGEDLTAGLIRRPPYADPHHNVSMAAMVGGGSRVARPGAISLAHRGVLFLDEAPHFESRVLDALRTPLESGWVSIARSQVTTRYPARFQLVLAANPCPCGLALTPGATCRCTPMSIRRYNDRLSGPILDRIDIHQYLLPMQKAFASLPHDSPEPTAVVAERVAEARRRAAARLKAYGWTTNVEASGKILRTQLLKPEGMELVDKAVSRGQLSSRGVDKVLRLAWTLADLAGRNRVIRDDIAAALQLRRGEWVGTAA